MKQFKQSQFRVIERKTSRKKQGILIKFLSHVRVKCLDSRLQGNTRLINKVSDPFATEIKLKDRLPSPALWYGLAVTYDCRAALKYISLSSSETNWNTLVWFEKLACCEVSTLVLTLADAITRRRRLLFHVDVDVVTASTNTLANGACANNAFQLPEDWLANRLEIIQMAEKGNPYYQKAGGRK